MADRIGPALVQLSEKVLNGQIKDGSIAYCPSMDLLALVTIDEQVDIYRLNGQKVLSVPPKRSCQTTQLCWKPNGSLLAISYSDNSISLIASQGGKPVHQIECPIINDATISFLGWTVNFTDVTKVQERLSSLQKQTSLDDVIHRGFLGEISKSKFDLPGDLSTLDVEGILPKLSTLPPGGKEGDVFTSRLSLDALFHSKDPKTNSTDALLVGFNDGSAYLSVHDFFEVGRFESKQISSLGQNLVVVKASSHPYASSIGILSRALESEKNALFFSPLDLRLVSDNGKQFSQLAAKATQMQNILRYLKECQTQTCIEFQSSQGLPHRFIANVEEDLLKDEDCDFTIAAYHLVATGNCSPVMKEWLVDQLTERGQKRWEKAALSGYENTRRLVHENLLPALDRLTVIANRLRGWSSFQETASAFGLETIEIDHVFDSIQCLQLLGHTTLMVSDSELRQSAAFCSWLRQEIDVQATETAISEESDKEPTFDFSEILSYIQGPLRHSMLYELLGIKKDGDDREPVPLPPIEYELYDTYKRALQRVKSGASTEARLPGMEVLIDRLQAQCSVIFAGIAGTQQKKVRFGEPVPLGFCDPDILDIRMSVADSNESSKCSNIIAVVAPDKTRMKVLDLELTIEKGVSSVHKTREALISARPSGKILDVKFVDDLSLFVLAEEKDSRYLFQLRYANKDGKSSDINFTASQKRMSAGDGDVLELFGSEGSSSLVRHIFKMVIPPFTPAKMEINGRKGRRAVCVLAEEMNQYRVFDIDAASEDDEVEQDRIDSEEDSVMVS